MRCRLQQKSSRIFLKLERKLVSECVIYKLQKVKTEASPRGKQAPKDKKKWAQKLKISFFVFSLVFELDFLVFWCLFAPRAPLIVSIVRSGLIIDLIFSHLFQPSNRLELSVFVSLVDQVRLKVRFNVSIMMCWRCSDDDKSWWICCLMAW